MVSLVVTRRWPYPDAKSSARQLLSRASSATECDIDFSRDDHLKCSLDGCLLQYAHQTDQAVLIEEIAAWVRADAPTGTRVPPAPRYRNAEVT